ncbi:MAG: FAD-dependent monooxygenase, partial [Candidatus Odinarchaeota archaeon]
MTVKKYDAVIIGAGPAGCAAALKLASEGVNTVIVEKKKLPREKICAGLLPEAAIQVLEEELNLKIPENVFEDPPTVGLVYIPPSGVKNAVLKLNYKLCNINRVKFDNWLASEAENKGVKIIQNTRPEKVIFKDKEIFLKTTSGETFQTSYLIGCDGVKSWVRSRIFNKDFPQAHVYQEAYLLKKEHTDIVKPYFYIFLNSQVCNLYSYIIRKKDRVILGTGNFNSQKNSKDIIKKMLEFKKLLTKEIPA